MIKGSQSWLADPRADAIEALHAATAIYTAEPIVDKLLQLLDWPQHHHRLVDPSCGDGAFLLRALERLLAVVDVHDDASLQRIEGWEIHPEACREAQQRIATRLILAGRTACDAARLAANMVHRKDFLTQGPELQTWDIISGNPPYLRWVGVPSILREDYRNTVPGYASADLLHSFLDRCTKSLRPGGCIGFVTSDRWLANKSCSELRERMGRLVSIAHIERLDAKTSFYRPKVRARSTPARVHPVAVILVSGQEALPITSQAIYPGVDQDRYKGLPTLGTVATVRLAPWLGTDGIFVVNEAVSASLPKERLVPVVDASDLSAGGVKSPSRFAIRTYPGEEPPTAIKDHLVREMPRMSQRGRKAGQWMPPETFHRWDLSQPSLMVPRIAQTVAPFWIEAGRLPIDHHLSISCDSQEQLEHISRALNHPLATSWLQDHGQRLENGYFYLTATLLRRVPLVL